MSGIALKNPFLGWLFGGKPKEDSPPEEVTAPDPAGGAAPEPVQAAPRHVLQLPPDHAIHHLWTLRSQQTGWLPKPSLCLEGPEGAGTEIADGTAQSSLSRVQVMVNTTANARLKQIQAAQKHAGADGKPPPPLDLDAQAAVVVSGDNMTAWLLIYPPVGQGGEITRDALDRALADKQVRFGIDSRLLDRLPQDPDRYFQLFPAAQGEPVVHGTDGRVVELFPRTVERKLKVDEHNRVDYMSLDFIQNVDAGTVICRIIPPTEGTPGRNVLDQEIPARNGKIAAAPKGRNTELSEDGSTLIASITGHVDFNGRTFQVKPMLEIDGNVDYSTGNINYVGDVCIHGDICSGFTVRAMGSITVDGVVEACTVEAGGDLVIAKGVQGDNQAVIRAQRNVFAKYLENACVYARETLQTDCIINCDVYCDGGVSVRSGRMTIIGGKVWAAHEVSAGIIGSRAESRTDICLGGQPCDAFDYDTLTREISAAEADLDAAGRQPDSPSKLSQVGKLRMQLIVSKKKLEQLDKERELLEQEPADPGIRRMLCDTVYAGTVLSIGDVVHHFDQELHPCRATLAYGEISLA